MDQYIDSEIFTVQEASKERANSVLSELMSPKSHSGLETAKSHLVINKDSNHTKEDNNMNKQRITPVYLR